MTIHARLAAIQARCDAATKGPWMVDPEDFGTILASNDGGFDGYHIADVHDHDGGMFPVEHNGQFIAHARADVPALLTAVQAVMKRHRPGPPYLLDVSEVCEHCSDNEDEREVAYPCPTIRDITDALDADATTREDQS